MSDLEERAEPVPVDMPEQRQPISAEVMAARTVDRRPVLAPWLRSRAEFRAPLVWLSRYGWHVTVFHVARLPMYLARLAARSPAGGWKLARELVEWVLDRLQRPLRAGAVQRSTVDEYLSLSKLRRERVKRRATIAGVLAVLVGIGVAVPVSWAPTWVLDVCGVLAVAILGVAGTPTDRRVLDVATVRPFISAPLRADQVTEALQALGISGNTAKGAELTYPAPITRAGPGWRADVDLSYGVARPYQGERAELASGAAPPAGLCVAGLGPRPARRPPRFVGRRPGSRACPSAAESRLVRTLGYRCARRPRHEREQCRHGALHRLAGWSTA